MFFKAGQVVVFDAGQVKVFYADQFALTVYSRSV